LFPKDHIEEYKTFVCIDTYMSNLRSFKHIDQFMEDEEDVPAASEYLDEGPPQYKFGSSYSYYESIHEFNQAQYGGASYSVYQLGKHLLNLIFSCRLFRRYNTI